MITKHKKFDLFVTFIVVITGGGFGYLTGLVYSVSYGWPGASMGIISSFILAKLYLKQLMKLSAKGYNSVQIWFSGTLAGVVCGLICTALVHGIMMSILYTSNVRLFDQADMGGMVLAVGLITGVTAGFIVGGICSLVYVLLQKDNPSETV